MEADSRSSSPDSPPPPEGADDSDYYAQPNDSQTSLATVGGSLLKDASLLQSLEAGVNDIDMTPVHRLPNEILMYIFGKFDSAHDLFTCMQVCKRWARHSVALLWHRPACTNSDNLGAICQVLNKPRPFFSYNQFVRRLNLSHLAAQINDGSIMSLAVCSRIERLTIVNCHSVTDLGLVSLVEKTKGLLALDASNAVNITGASLDAIASNCPRMQGLNITNCQAISNESLIRVAQNSKYLKRVCLTYDCDLPSSDLFPG